MYKHQNPNNIREVLSSNPLPLWGIFCSCASSLFFLSFHDFSKYGIINCNWKTKYNWHKLHDRKNDDLIFHSRFAWVYLFATSMLHLCYFTFIKNDTKSYILSYHICFYECHRIIKFPGPVSHDMAWCSIRVNLNSKWAS